MPSLPDIPGKSLVTGTGRRAGKVAAGAGLAALAVGGYAARRLLRRSSRGSGGDEGASADPIAETATAPPGAKEPAPDAPPEPTTEPGDISKDKDPHHALNNPVGDPDPTEWPDPYEKRDDPRDPGDPDDQPFGEEPHPATGAESTSEPHPGEDPEAGDLAEPPKRDNLDD